MQSHEKEFQMIEEIHSEDDDDDDDDDDDEFEESISKSDPDSDQYCTCYVYFVVHLLYLNKRDFIFHHSDKPST